MEIQPIHLVLTVVVTIVFVVAGMNFMHRNTRNRIEEQEGIRDQCLSEVLRSYELLKNQDEIFINELKRRIELDKYLIEHLRNEIERIKNG